MSSETRVVDADTGGEKGKKLERFDLIPVGPLEAVAKHYGIGASKYADRNWERGYKWSLSFAAMMRHAWAFWRGEDTDPENGSPHLAAVVFHAFALMEYGRTHPEKDDRPERTTIVLDSGVRAKPFTPILVDWLGIQTSGVSSIDDQARDIRWTLR